MQSIKKILNKFKYFKNKIFIDKYVKNYIAFNKFKWSSFKVDNPKGIVLVDLWDHYPFIHIWSYLVNILAKEQKLEIKYFYFFFYKSRFEKTFLYLRKIKKIFNSLNIRKGIDEKKYKITKLKNKKKIKKIFNYLNKKKKIIEYKYNNILIGDLIYDTYLRNTLNPTIILNDPHLFEIFVRAHKIFDEIQFFFSTNKVRVVIPSHTHYIQFGIITRIALKNKIKVFKIFETNKGNSNLRVRNLSLDFPKERERYFEYKKEFSKLNNKNKLRDKGKSILLKRLSGTKDNSLPYMKHNTYKKFNNSKLNKKLRVKNKVIIFAHCFFDSPHKHRKMLFEDFYQQLNFILSLSNNNDEYNWFIKPHPTSAWDKNEKIIKEIFLKKYKKVQLLHKNTSNALIAKSKPKLIITDHGTIAHEMAYHNIPVLNTGDNPHINYRFNLHASSKTHIKKIISNLPYHIKKIDFNRNSIFEFVYMQYLHRMNIENEDNYIKSNFFGKENAELNSNNKILNYIIKQDNKNSKNIFSYINNFILNNFKP